MNGLLEPHIQAPSPRPIASSTQAGSIAECLVAAAIMEASAGRLAPFKPLADDDGIDLLLFDKITQRATPVQIKARRTYDDVKGQRVQFDIRRRAFNEDRALDYLFVKLDRLRIEMAWLIPASKLMGVARAKDTTLVSVVCAKATGKDPFQAYRRGSIDEVVAEILARKTS